MWDMMAKSILVHLTETNSITKSIFKTTRTKLLVMQTTMLRIKEGAKISLSVKGLSTTKEKEIMQRLRMELRVDATPQAKINWEVAIIQMLSTKGADSMNLPCKIELGGTIVQSKIYQALTKCLFFTHSNSNNFHLWKISDKDPFLILNS